MSRKIDKNKNENHDKNELQIRSSAAEYLTFIAANGDDHEAIETVANALVKGSSKFT